MASEFKTKRAEAALNTMVEWPSVNHVPVHDWSAASSQRLIKVAEGMASRANLATGSTCWELALEICDSLFAQRTGQNVKNACQANLA